jgi:hypothetical protein
MSRQLQVPLIYRLSLLYIEPVLALVGAYKLHFAPESYFSYMPSSSAYSPQSQIVCTQLAAAYVCFSVIEALVLRSTNDIKVWRSVVLALLLCDIGTAYAAWVEMGGDVFWWPWRWEGMDRATMTLTAGPLAVRAAFLLGVGLGKG